MSHKREVRRSEGRVCFNVLNEGRPTFISPVYVDGARVGSFWEVASEEQVCAATPTQAER